MRLQKSFAKIAAITGVVATSICIAIGGAVFSGFNSNGATAAYAGEQTSTDAHGFIKVDGEKLYDENGQEYVIKSMGMGNAVWSNPDAPVTTYANEESYKELSELGFNAVRFYVNVNLLEDKNNPYNYKETGFAWVSKNIEWAKKYNMKVLINMHVPAGGFIKPENVSFWKDENVARYKALWMEIVRRYKDESAVLGYGLLNEPYLPSLVVTEPADLPTDSAEVKKQKKAQRDAQQQIYYAEAKDKYYALMNEMTSKFRAAGDNHIVFVERTYGCSLFNDAGKYVGVDYPWGYTDSYELLNDDNVVYEYHYYYPMQFTHQEYTKFSENINYPNDKIAYVVGARTFPKVHKNTVNNYDPTASGWQKIESSMIKNDGSFNYGYWIFETSKLGSNGDLYLDEITISEYDESGKYVRDIYMYDFSTAKNLNVWNKDGSVKNYEGSADGHNSPGCMKIHGGDKGVRCYLNGDAYMNVVMKKGYSYKVSAYVKFENCSAETTFDPEIQLCKGENVMTSGKDYLEYMLNVFLDYGRTNHVPMYMGEFGVTTYMMVDPDGDNWVEDTMHNGGQWVGDMLDLLKKYQAHYSYHDYHDENFGMYMDGQWSVCSKKKLNWVLYDVFEKKIEKDTIKTGLITVDGDLYYYTTEGVMATDYFYNKDGKRYYFGNDGKAITGLKKCSNGYIYYFQGANGVATGLKTVNGEIYYFNPNTGAALNGWRTINGNTYFFVNSTRTACKGLKTIDGNLYYFTTAGVMKTDYFYNKDGKRYYFGSDGKTITGLKKCSNGYIYYFQGANGVATGLKTVNGDIYYFNPSSGAALSGWRTINGNTYYFVNSTRKASKGLKSIAGDLYYFTTAGVMKTDYFYNKDGKRYYFGSDGKAITGLKKCSNGYIYYFLGADGVATGLNEVEGEIYYFNPTTGAALNGWREVAGNTYYFVNSTRCACKGIRTIDGAVYRFGNDGVLIEKIS